MNTECLMNLLCEVIIDFVICSFTNIRTGFEFLIIVLNISIILLVFATSCS